jgi:hypothetical protein
LGLSSMFLKNNTICEISTSWIEKTSRPPTASQGTSQKVTVVAA